MPLVLITLFTAAVARRFAPRRVALTLTWACAAVTMIAFVRAAADGQGNEPWWLVGVAVVCSILQVAMADRLGRRRQRLTA